MKVRSGLLPWLFVVTCVLGLALALLTPPAAALEQTASKSSPVLTGVGSPRVYLDTAPTTGDSVVGDGTNPVLLPWGTVVQVSCPGLVGGTDQVLAAFSMHIDATADVSDGHLSDGTIDDQAHGMILDAAMPVDDMRLEARRFFANGTSYAGAQFTGACDREGTAYHLAPCTVAGEAADCGAASTCDTGAWRTTSERSIDKIAGAWLILDGTASTACFARVDI